MSSPDARVRGLVDAGQITPAEGERLRRALRGPSGLVAIIFNPVEYLHPTWSALVAVLVVLASIAVSQLGVRFDGALDMHAAGGAPRWSHVVADQLAAVVCTAVILWSASLIVARQGRLQDFVVGVAVARAPLLLSAVVAAMFMPTPAEMLQYVENRQVPPAVLFVSLATLPCMVWFFTWLYRGFAHAAGMSGARAGVTFVIAIVVAEAASKGLLMLMMRGFS